MKPDFDRRKLSSDQLAQLEQWEVSHDQLGKLEDIAAMTQEVVTLLGNKSDSKSLEGMGSLLLDIRESLTSLKDKEAPEIPDYAKPVVESVSQLETALTAAVKAINVQPQVSVQAPEVNVPEVNLKGVEKALGAMPKAFKEAIAAIPATPETDLSPLLEAWSGISEQLASIETATRLKPQAPNQLKVTNTDGSSVGGLLPVKDYNSINVDATSSVVDTLTFKQGATTVRTITVTYTGTQEDKISHDLVSVAFA